jgi:uncharacterized cupin superfamily protein
MEWLAVPAGGPAMRTPGGEPRLAPWDTVFPEGEAGAHRLGNGTDEPGRVAIRSTKQVRNATDDPEDDRIFARPQGLLRLGDALASRTPDPWDA